MIDDNCEWLGISRLQLMENAGSSIARTVLEKVGDLRRKKVVVIAGLGNNGGDGFVAARHLASLGSKVTVMLLGEPSSIRTEEARRNWNILEKMVSVEKEIIRTREEILMMREKVVSADVIVDAILGTGIKGEPREPLKTAISIINESKGLKVSVDVPSGLDPDTGEFKVAVKSDVTVTFHAMKRGLIIAREICGEILVVNIGIPKEAELYVGPGNLRASIKARRRDSHKGDFGRILIIGGSEKYSGAPALAALAALRCGADIAVVVAPEKVSGIIRSFSPSIIVYEYPGGWFDDRGVDLIKNIIQRFDSIVIGPGLGLNEKTRVACLKVLDIIREYGKPVVIDADALKIISDNVHALRGLRAVLTPHRGEFLTLTGSSLDESLSLEKKIDIVRSYAKRFNVTLLVKGPEDLISDGDRCYVNITGNPGMTVGGTGDVLSGIVATFLAWGNDAVDAAATAAFVNGVAGDMAVEEKGYHITPEDVIEKIPFVFKKFGLP